jgi:hypothetical protein
MAKATKGKSAKSKPAGAQLAKGGNTAMHAMKGAGQQAPGGSAVAAGDNTSGKFAKAGGSGKMQSFTPVKPQKAGRSGQTG